MVLGATLGATKEGKMAPFFCKRHQTRHLDFPSHPLLTEELEVRFGTKPKGERATTVGNIGAISLN
jgi:hypothetical protein